MRHHVLYKTTNLLNGKVYYGRHSTENLNDGYLGSGLAIRRAISKYGKRNFTREILKSCDSLQQLLEEEKALITEDIILDPMTYNMCGGGLGTPGSRGRVGRRYGPKHHTPETKQKMSLVKKGKTLTDEHKSKIAKSLTGKTPSTETRRKMSMRKVGRQHPGYGSFWVNDGITSKKCYGLIPEGWVRGRIISETQRVKMVFGIRKYFQNGCFEK